MIKIGQLAKIAALACGGILTHGSIVPTRALTFNFIPEAGTPQPAIDGFNAAGALWSNLFNDNVTVNIGVGFKALPAGTLGESSTTTQSYSYSQVYSALSRDRTSADDNTAVNSLANGASFPVLINRTANNPNGSGSATPYLDNNGDANNSTIAPSTANAKALGLRDNSGTDANIAFNTAFTWDFNRGDGIAGGAFDFVGVAAHEIGHALGFNSGVDILDGNSTNGRAYSDSTFAQASPLDLFRYSLESKNAGAIDFTADTRSKYLSIDRGNTKIADLSTGANFGDGSQASHWLDNAGLGILSPKLAAGSLLQISDNDRRALDVMGWNLAGNNPSNAQQLLALNANNTFTGYADASVPEPSGMLGLLLSGGCVVRLMRKRRQ